MSSLIRGARYVPDAVVLGGGRPKSFNLSSFIQPDRRKTPKPDPVAVERERLETARLQAERIVAEAEAKAAETLRQATIRGYEEGFAEGLQRADDQAGEELRRLAKLIDSTLADHDALVRSAQREAAILALAVASKILNREVLLDSETVLSVVQGALERIPPAERVRVLVNPEDEDLVRERWAEVAGGTARGRECDLVTDPSIGRGGCVIEAGSGFVDCRIETQVAKLTEAFEADL